MDYWINTETQEKYQANEQGLLRLLYDWLFDTDYRPVANAVRNKSESVMNRFIQSHGADMDVVYDEITRRFIRKHIATIMDKSDNSLVLDDTHRYCRLRENRTVGQQDTSEKCHLDYRG